MAKKKRIFAPKIFSVFVLFNLTLLIFTVVLLLLPKIQPYVISVSQEQIDENREIYFHDFDHNGDSEKVEMKYIKENDESAVKIYTAKGEELGQWNFAENWENKATFFGDFNNNGSDELYVFTKSRDSLFLYAFDPYAKTDDSKAVNEDDPADGFLLHRELIATAPKPAKHVKKPWNMIYSFAEMQDINGDVYAELVFTVIAGFRLQPRNCYIFDVRKRKIIAVSSKSYAVAQEPVLTDLNNDGRKEIILSGSSARCNAPDVPDSLNPDKSTYVFAFDDQLNYLFPPKCFPGSFSGLRNYPFNDGKKTTIISMGKKKGTDGDSNTLFQTSFDGTVLNSKVLPSNCKWQIAVSKGHYQDRLFCWNTNGLIQERDGNLEIIKTWQKKSMPEGKPFQFDISGDGLPEFIWPATGKLTIMPDDFSSMTTIPFLLNYNGIVSQKKRGTLPPQLAIFSDRDLFIYNYKTSMFYPYRYFIYSALLLFSVLSALIITRLYRRIKIVFGSKSYLLQAPRNGLLILDYRGRIIDYNTELSRVLKLRKKIYFKQNYSELFDKHPQITEFIDRLLMSEDVQRQGLIVNDSSLYFQGDIIGTPIRDFSKIPMAYFIDIIDHSSPVQSERLSSWSKTVQKMAHDIKTPLSAVQLSLQTMQMKIADHSPETLNKIETDYELVFSELSRVREMTKNFLKFSNLQKPNMAFISLQDVLNKSVEHFTQYQNGNLKINLEIEKEMDQLWADFNQLEMVCQIIIENAIDAMEGKGEILVSSSLAQYLDDNFRRYQEIDFADTGNGIPEEIINQVFEPYFSTKKDGNGMGLAIAKKIIEDHGGRMEITSRRNFATVVKIMLPIGDKIDV